MNCLKALLIFTICLTNFSIAAIEIDSDCERLLLNKLLNEWQDGAPTQANLQESIKLILAQAKGTINASGLFGSGPSYEVEDRFEEGFLEKVALYSLSSRSHERSYENLNVELATELVLEHLHNCQIRRGVEKRLIQLTDEWIKAQRDKPIGVAEWNRVDPELKRLVSGVGIRLTSSTGYFFKLDSKIEGAPVWQDETSQLKWFPAEKEKMTHDQAVAKFNTPESRLPTREEFQEAQRHGFLDIVVIPAERIWSSSFMHACTAYFFDSTYNMHGFRNAHINYGNWHSNENAVVRVGR